MTHPRMEARRAQVERTRLANVIVLADYRQPVPRWRRWASRALEALAYVLAVSWVLVALLGRIVLALGGGE